MDGGLVGLEHRGVSREAVVAAVGLAAVAVIAIDVPSLSLGSVAFVPLELQASHPFPDPVEKQLRLTVIAA